MQLSARDAMQAAAVTWSGISDARRAGWNAYALTTDYLNGRSAFIAGYSLTYFLIDWYAAAMTLTADPPTVPGPLLINDFEPVYSLPAPPQYGICTRVRNCENEAITLYIQGVNNMSPGRNYHAGPWNADLSKVRYADALGYRRATINGDEGLAIFMRIRAVSRYGPKRVSPFYRYRDISYLIAEE